MKATYSKRFLPKKPMPKIRTIEDYLKAKKRLSLESFTEKDIEQITNTIEGFIVVNNCKIPIKNGSLLLNQWINRHKEKKIKPLSETEKKLSRKKSQKRYREKQKLIKKNLIEIDDKPNTELTVINMPYKFRDYGTKKSMSDKPKRLITAIRLSKQKKPKINKQRLNVCANIPIQHLILCTAKYLKFLANEKGEKIDFKGYKEHLIKANRINKKYKPIPLYLKTISGEIYQYTDKGLILIK